MDGFVTLVSFLVIAVLAIGIGAGMNGRRLRKENVSLDALLAVLKRSGPVFPWLRIVVARPEFIVHRLSFRRYEMKGLAVQQPDGLRVLAVLPEGGLIDRFFPYSSAEFVWKGDIKPDDGSLFWMQLGSNDKAVYLSADPTVYQRQPELVTQDLFLQSAPSGEREVFPMRRKTVWFLRGALNLGVVWMWVFWFFVSFSDYTAGALSSDLHRMIWGAWPLLSFVGTLCALALACFSVLFWAKVGVRAAVSSAVLVAVVTGFVVDPLVLYLDRKFASEPERIVLYRMLEKGRLEALEPGFPALRFYDSEYWQHFLRGSRHEFVFQRGALGVWQHKPARYEARVKAFSDVHAK